MIKRIDMGVRVAGDKARKPDEFVVKSQLTTPDGNALSVAANGDLIVPAATSDHLVLVDELDDTPGTLLDKIYPAAENVTISVVESGGERVLEIGVEESTSNLPMGTAIGQLMAWDGNNWIPIDALKIQDLGGGFWYIEGNVNSMFFDSTGDMRFDVNNGFVINANYSTIALNGPLYNETFAGTRTRLMVVGSNGYMQPQNDGVILQRVKRTLTPSELRALHTTPIELIAAPGENKIAKVISATILVNYDGSQAYSGSFSVCYNSSIYDDAVFESNISVSQSYDEVICTHGTDNYFDPAAIVNKNITAKTNTAITNDNATGTVVISLTYEIVDLT